MDEIEPIELTTAEEAALERIRNLEWKKASRIVTTPASLYTVTVDITPQDSLRDERALLTKLAQAWIIDFKDNESNVTWQDKKLTLALTKKDLETLDVPIAQSQDMPQAGRASGGRSGRMGNP